MGKKILVVEDESALHKVLKDKLEKEGYQVQVATDGSDALLFVQEFMPDMVLLDMILPKVDGMSVLETIHKEEKTKNIPVVILTNLDNGDKAEQAKAMGAHDYLIKTEWTLDQLLAKVKGIIGEAN